MMHTSCAKFLLPTGDIFFILSKDSGARFTRIFLRHPSWPTISLCHGRHFPVHYAAHHRISQRTLLGLSIDSKALMLTISEKLPTRFFLPLAALPLDLVAEMPSTIIIHLMMMVEEVAGEEEMGRQDQDQDHRREVVGVVVGE
ncbi:hypothetical protein ACFE04_003190 [Oxalis oulophora]